MGLILAPRSGNSFWPNPQAWDWAASVSDRLAWASANRHDPTAQLSTSAVRPPPSGFHAIDSQWTKPCCIRAPMPGHSWSCVRSESQWIVSWGWALAAGLAAGLTASLTAGLGAGPGATASPDWVFHPVARDAIRPCGRQVATWLGMRAQTRSDVMTRRWLRPAFIAAPMSDHMRLEFPGHGHGAGPGPPSVFTRGIGTLLPMAL